MAKKSEKKDNVRKLPYNIETERFLLGEILINNDIASDSVAGLHANDFYDAAHETIFEAMIRLMSKNSPIDYLTVIDELRAMGKLEEVGGEEYILDLANGVVTTVNAKEHMDMIKRDSVLRSIVAAGNNICDIGYSGKTAEAAIVSADSELRKVSEGLEISELEQVAEMAAAAYREIEEAQLGNVSKKRVYTGFPVLDKTLKGLKPGIVYVLAARPGVGKSALALNIATNVALDGGKRVAFFSLEMGGIEICRRVLASRSMISSDAMDKMAGLTEFQKQKLMQAYRALSNSQLYIDASSLNTPIQIYNKCKRLARNDNGLDLIIIDYLQLMTLDDQNKNRQEIVSQLSRLIKVYAKELGVPVILLSQLNRESVKDNGVAVSEDKKPQLKDLRESGSIEQDADTVMFLHNPKGVDVNIPGAEVQLLIEKNRSGKNHVKIKLQWYADYTLFVEDPNQTDIKKDDEEKVEVGPTPAGEIMQEDKVFLEEDAGDVVFEEETSDIDGDIPF